jgi:Asp-tRNA(Asn)/Glu-tRNA(Gln) amidotransferase A subunit family amidase
LLGPYWSEPMLLKLSHAYEQARPFLERPPISAS